MKSNIQEDSLPEPTPKEETPPPPEPAPQPAFDPTALPGSFPPIFDLAGLQFPVHWDGSLRTQTERIYRLGAWDPRYFDHSVRDAALFLEMRIRQLCDAPPELIGVKLMDLAFKNDEPRGQLLTRSILDAEAQGIHSLFRGAILQIRNPLGHREVNMRPDEAFDSIAFISYLLRTANELALRTYVFPFVPEREKWRGIHLTRWVDIDGDGEDEFVIVIGERSFRETSGGEGRVLVLKHDLLQSVGGILPLLPNAYYGPHLVVGDLDNDGLPEIVASMQGDGSRDRSGIVVDWHEGVLRAETKVGKEPLKSHVWPFEVLTPMSTAPHSVLAWYTETGKLGYARFIDGELVPLEGDAF